VIIRIYSYTDLKLAVHLNFWNFDEKLIKYDIKSYENSKY